MTKSRRVQTVTVLDARSTTIRSEAKPAYAEAGLYGVAMLKVAMELKKSPGAELEPIVRRVISAMRLDEASFRQYFERNGGLLKRVGPKRP